MLCALGTWQVKRLIWKEALIARVETRIAKEPVGLLELGPDQLISEESNYLPVFVEGRFDHSKEVLFFTTGKGGVSGWNIHTPLQISNGKVLIVNRGFVPDGLKSPKSRLDGEIDGTVSITGLLRIPVAEKPNRFFPDNDITNREFFWRDHPHISALMADNPEIDFLPVFLDAAETENPGGWPKGGATIISFSNNHLQYAITWFGLAAALLAVGGFFVFSRLKNMHYNQSEK